MLLNVAPPIDSSLPAEAVRAYAQLGSFVRACYGEGSVAAPTALATTAAPCASCSVLKLSIGEGGAPSAFDRLLIKEELSGGQRVTAFTLLADGVPIFNGSSIGRTLVAR